MALVVTARDCFVKKTKEEEEAVERSYAEYKEIISTLPREKGWLTEYIYQYRGFWFQPDYGLEGIMRMQEHFKARSDDVLLTTTPKCGTTWVKAIIFSIMNRTRYDVSKHPLLSNNPHECVPSLEIRLLRVTPVGDPDVLPVPRLLCTHAPYSLLPKSVIHSGCRIIYTCRNPKDVFVSMFHFMAKLRLEGLPPLSLEEAFDLFCKGASTFGPFWDHVIEYWTASLEFPTRILFLKYEDMKKNPSVYANKIADFLGRPFSLEEKETGVVQEIVDLCSFEKLSKLEVNKTGHFRANLKNDVFFRQGKVGDWKNYLTPQMIERVDQITEEKFAGLGLTF